MLNCEALLANRAWYKRIFNTVMRCTGFFIGFFVLGPPGLVGLRILIAWQCRQEKELDWKVELQRRMSKAQKLRDLIQPRKDGSGP